MGKLKITGNAERKFSCDAMKVTLTFSASEKTTALAAKTVREHCENFLLILQEQGIAISDISLEDDSVEEDELENGLEIAMARREISLKTSYHMPFINQLNELISTVSYNVYLGTNFYISNMPEVRRQLLKEAVEDSRNQAQMIADMMGQKITGIEKVTKNDFHNDMLWMCQENEYGGCRSKLSISDQLKSPERTESEHVEVVWNIE